MSLRSCRRGVVLVCCLLMTGAMCASSAEVADTYHRDHRTSPALVLQPDTQDLGSLTDPVAIAEAYLDVNRELYQLSTGSSDLAMSRIRHSLLGTHIYFQQFHEAIPVKGAEIVVSVSHDLDISMVYNNTYPIIERPASSRAVLDSEAALDKAWAHLGVRGEIISHLPSADLLWVPQGQGLRLTWDVRVGTEDPFGRWALRIDALTGAVLETRRTELSRKPYGKPVYGAPEDQIIARQPAEDRSRIMQAAQDQGLSGNRATVDGSGDVFDPDPRTSLNNASLTDGSAASAFTSAYFTRVLKDITDTGGTKSLVGPWITISNFESPNTAPSTTASGIWTAVRGDNAFNDAMTYFHIDQNQRYMQSLGFTGSTGIQEGSIETDTDGLNGNDNSYFLPGSNQMAFGHGCVDDNEDADVILHEYGHAIHFSINSSWGGGDTGAMGEGFGDYWAVSYGWGTPNGPVFEPFHVYSWDGISSCWPGRIVNDLGAQYNPSATYGAHATVGGVLGDQLWSTPLVSSMIDIIGATRPRADADKIILQSHFGLGSGMSMRDMGTSTVAAANALFPAGPHANIFQNNFANHNILDLPAVQAPTITYPAGGENVPAGANSNVTWTTGAAVTSTVYSVSYTDQCTPTVSFADDMESGTGLWAVSHGSGSADWALGTSTPHSPANAWMATQPTTIADQYLVTASAVAVGAGAELRFWHTYDTESGFDGGVVEVSTNGGSGWTDLDGSFTQNAYNGSISTGFSSPIAGQAAFTGNSSGYLETVADLSAFSGTSILVRFRMASDSSANGNGWWVDDVSIQSGGSWTAIGDSAPGGTSIAWTVPAGPGTDYCVGISAAAPGFTGSSTQGGVFSVTGGSDLIFADDFETGSTGMWSVR